jgi:hypothetical protein
MDLEFILMSLGTIPLLASRGALPIFISALLARFGENWAWLAQQGAFEFVAGLPDWLTSDIALAVLGVAAALEHLVMRSPEGREAIGIGESELKGILAGVFTLLMILGMQENAAELAKASDSGLWNLSSLWSAGIGFAVWKVARLRRAVLAFYDEIDPDDALGIQALFAWLETALGVLGPFLVVILPLFALLAAVIALSGLALLRRYFSRVEAKQYSDCRCGTRHHRSALQCPGCERPLEAEAVGLFGQAKGKPASAPADHRLALLAVSRCGSCATRLKSPRVSESCTTCGDRHFASPEAGATYLARQRRRLPLALIVSGLFGLIPIVGVIPGLVFYRLYLITGLRTWLPLGSALLGRWTLGLLGVLLVALQAFPIVGALSLPLLCLMNYAVYGRQLRRQFNER